MRRRSNSTPFDEMFQIVDALTLEYHKLICQTRVIPGEKNPLIPMMLMAKENTLRDHGWTSEDFLYECNKHLVVSSSHFLNQIS